MLFVALYLHFQHSMLIFAMAYARLAIVFYMLPALGERVLANLIIKNTIIALTIIGLWPYLEHGIIPDQGWLIILVKECVIGLILAIAIAAPFWCVVGLGEILDNQRGATISESIDPVNGQQSSVMSSFLNFAFSAIFFTSGGMRTVMEILAQSYRVCPRGSELIDFNWQYSGHLLMMVVKGSIVLAAPIMLVLMITEILLGVFARYCPQLNPFSLSLSLKSFIAFSLLLLYGFQSLTEKPLKMISDAMIQQFFP